MRGALFLARRPLVATHFSVLGLEPGSVVGHWIFSQPLVVVLVECFYGAFEDFQVQLEPRWFWRNKVQQLKEFSHVAGSGSGPSSGLAGLPLVFFGSSGAERQRARRRVRPRVSAAGVRAYQQDGPQVRTASRAAETSREQPVCLIDLPVSLSVQSAQQLHDVDAGSEECRQSGPALRERSGQTAGESLRNQEGSSHLRLQPRFLVRLWAPAQSDQWFCYRDSFLQNISNIFHPRLNFEVQNNILGRRDVNWSRDTVGHIRAL